MTEKIFLNQIHKRLSIISVGASALRNQGSSGIIKIAREYFYEININEFINSLDNEDVYNNFLDKHTTNLVSKFPENGKSWGGARKGINLFLREVVYNKFFSDYYQLPTQYNEFNQKIKFLEVPLDKDVATGIYEETELVLPRWNSIKDLTPNLSKQYQIAALKIAAKGNFAKVNLDLKYWRRE